MMIKESVSFDQILTNQGIPEKDRNPEEYMFYQIPEHVSEKHGGEWWALPRRISIKGHEGEYDLHENGSAVHINSEVVNSAIGDGSIIHEGAKIHTSIVGRFSEIGEKSRITTRSILGTYVSVGPNANIYETILDYSVKIKGSVEPNKQSHITGSEIGAETTIGADANIAGLITGSRTSIGDNFECGKAGCRVRNKFKLGYRPPERNVILAGLVEIGDDVSIYQGVFVSSDVVVEDLVKIKSGVSISNTTKIGKAASIGAGATIGREASVDEHAVVKAGKRLKDNKVAYVNEKEQTRYRSKLSH